MYVLMCARMVASIYVCLEIFIVSIYMYVCSLCTAYIYTTWLDRWMDIEMEGWGDGWRQGGIKRWGREEGKKEGMDMCVGKCMYLIKYKHGKSPL